MSEWTVNYDAELDRGYPWFTYPEFAAWLPTQARTIVEVGSWKGFSTVAFARGLQARPDGGWLYAVDVWDRKGAYWRDFTTRFPDDPASHLYACFLRHLQREGVTDVVLPHRMTSLIAAAQFREAGRTFDAAFIDADHRYGAVKADILAWRPLVRPGGIIAGHDYNNRDVRRAVDELIPGVLGMDGHTWWKRL
jgi:predicted O-methyltransferase YrrM